MRIKGLFWGIIVALAVFACNNDENVATTEQGVNPNLNAYMTLKFGSNAKLRTAADNGTIAGTYDENKISKLNVILCKEGATRNEFEVAQIIKSNDLTFRETSTGADVLAFKVATGIYHVYVITNTDVPASVTVGTKEQALIGEITTLSNYATAGAFIMTNAFHLPTTAEGLPVDITSVEVKQTNTINNPANVEVYVDRLAAKVTYTPTSTVNVDEVKTALKDETVTIAFDNKVWPLNRIKKSYLFQHWGENYAPALATDKTYYQQLIAVPWSLGTDYYSNLFSDTYTDYRTVAVTGSGANAQYTEVVDKLKGSSATSSSFYCLENNPEEHTYDASWAAVPNTKDKFYTTGMIFKATASCGTFVTINGKVFTGVNFEAVIDNIGQSTYKTIFCKNYGIGNDFTIPTGATASDIATIVANAIAYAKANFTYSDGRVRASDFRTAFNAKVYEDGVMYYTFYIKDRNYKEANKDATTAITNPYINYYSIMRNTQYQINVTALKAIGDDIPGGWIPDPKYPDPTPDCDPTKPIEPIDTYKAYMVVDVIVNNWVLSIDNIEL